MDLRGPRDKRGGRSNPVGLSLRGPRVRRGGRSNPAGLSLRGPRAKCFPKGSNCCIPNPNGVAALSPGLRRRRYPGKGREINIQPQRGCVRTTPPCECQCPARRDTGSGGDGSVQIRQAGPPHSVIGVIADQAVGGVRDPVEAAQVVIGVFYRHPRGIDKARS